LEETQEARQQVDALDVSLPGVVVVPAEELVLVHVGFLGNGVVEDKAGILRLVGPHQRLYLEPKLSGGQIVAAQKAGETVMRDGSAEQGRETCGCRWTLAAEQIVAV
jgi:hypothetical protein